MTRITKCFAAGLLLAATIQTAGATLIAQWSFNAGNSGDLTADIGGYTFTESGAGGGQTTTYNGDGTVSIGAGRGLFAAGINSTDISALKDNATIYVRMAWVARPTTFALHHGFVDTGASASGGDYNTITALAQVGGSSDTDIKGAANAGFNAGTGGSSFTAPALGEFETYAITYEPGTGTLHMGNNTPLTFGTGSGSPSLIDFQSFAIGRILQDKPVGGMRIDEIRIYDETLTAGQIAAIPEPGTLTMLCLGAAAFLLMFRRRG